MSTKTTINGNGKAYETNTKRFYLPCAITSHCPECGEQVTLDQSCDLSYPVANVPIAVNFHHEFEAPDGSFLDHEWSVPIRLVIEIELIEVGELNPRAQSTDDQSQRLKDGLKTIRKVMDYTVTGMEGVSRQRIWLMNQLDALLRGEEISEPPRASGVARNLEIE